MKSMQEKDSIMDFGVNRKFRHSVSLVMPNSYPCDGIFNPHLTAIEDSYNLTVVNH